MCWKYRVGMGWDGWSVGSSGVCSSGLIFGLVMKRYPFHSDVSTKIECNLWRIIRDLICIHAEERKLPTPIRRRHRVSTHCGSPQALDKVPPSMYAQLGPVATPSIFT